MIFSFILILLIIQTAIQLSKTMISEETFMGQTFHKEEVVQIQAIEKLNTWLKLVWSNIENLKCIFLLKFSTPSENHIDMLRKWLWNGKECTITIQTHNVEYIDAMHLIIKLHKIYIYVYILYSNTNNVALLK